MTVHEPSIRLESQGALPLEVPRNALLMMFPRRLLLDGIRLNHTKAVIRKTPASIDAYFLRGIEKVINTTINVAQMYSFHLALN